MGIPMIVGDHGQDPDLTARQAGVDIYECSVGSLRRAELWRLGNKWGLNFPSGCTKDFMLPRFKQLEAQGHNLFRPPEGGVTAEFLSSHRPIHEGETHSEPIDEEEPIQSLEEHALREKLEGLQFWEVKKMVKDAGLYQTNTDSREDLITRLLES